MMLIQASDQRLRYYVRGLMGAALVVCACGGKSGSDSQSATGGATVSAGTGGVSSDGGSATAGSPSGGTNAGSPNGGATPITDGGSTQMPNCAKVTCPAIPTTCKKLVQDPAACCPTCLDSGCGECPQIKCAAGTHSETPPGDCCPSCVANPPDACEQGQKSYDTQRAQLFEKYSSASCKNSTDCTLVLEDNACAHVCNVPLAYVTSQSFTNNLSNAATACSTCPPPDQTPCEVQNPACLNGKCVAAEAAQR